MSFLDLFRPPSQWPGSSAVERRAIPSVYPVPTHDEYLQGAPVPGSTGGSNRWSLALPAVFRAVNIMQSLAAQLELIEQRAAASFTGAARPRWEYVHPSPFMQRPDPLLTRGAFAARYVGHMAMRGEAALRLYRDPQTRQVERCELIYAPDFRIEWNRDMTAPVYSWRERPLSVWDDVLHIKYLDVPGELHGIGPIQAARGNLIGSVAQQRWISSLYGGSAVPAGNLQVPYEVDDTEAAELLAKWEASHMGVARTGLLSGGVTYSAEGLSPHDAQYVDSHVRSVQDVAALFGIDPWLLAAALQGSSLTYQNLADVHRGIYKLTLHPTYLAPLEEHLAAVLPAGRRARFNFDDLTRPEDRVRFETWKLAVESGILTPDEAREREGLPPAEPVEPRQLAAVTEFDRREAQTNAG